MKRFSQITRFARPEESLRAAVERAPQVEALAASWIERVRPLVMRICRLRRKIAALALSVLAASLLAHVMFGANGWVVYRQKRAEYEALQKQIEKVRQENSRYTEQIQGLQSDQKAIEKEAREQLGYAKPGEYVYVAPAPVKAPPPPTHAAKK
jgi:cell division protein FtsB